MAQATRFQVSKISVPDARTITLQPFEKTCYMIEKHHGC
jgi:ribosome recycling factor